MPNILFKAVTRFQAAKSSDKNFSITTTFYVGFNPSYIYSDCLNFTSYGCANY